MERRTWLPRGQSQASIQLGTQRNPACPRGKRGECCRGAWGQLRGTSWPTSTHGGPPANHPPSLHPLPTQVLHLSPAFLSIHVREAHAQCAVPGQPFSPASFTPANTRTITHTHTGPSPAPPAPRTAVYTASVCEREAEAEAASVEEGALTLQPRLQGQQGCGCRAATSLSGPSLVCKIERTGSWGPSQAAMGIRN